MVDPCHSVSVHREFHWKMHKAQHQHYHSGPLSSFSTINICNHYVTCRMPIVNSNSTITSNKLECEPMPNVMVALLNVGGAFCSMPQSLADAHYLHPTENCENFCQILRSSLLNFVKFCDTTLPKFANFSDQFLLSGMCCTIVFSWFVHWYYYINVYSRRGQISPAVNVRPIR